MLSNIKKRGKDEKNYGHFNYDNTNDKWLYNNIWT